ncbi:WhiB-family transcriptional regulator [Streptomyces clavuligerus]|uniref:Transcriptional regulator WhiB n=1 Tax=Streptomyces clavuligerus TaxID=1901 RepID=B5GYV0_STRCL|nr:whiD [Streptomyces clavuligerus]EFG08770.1 WhiB-family transcriptional regulator [Streptomyces clavuligerus]
MADFSRLPGPNADLWDWQLLAACRGVDSSLFFHPEGERGAARSARENSAKEVCMRCPVRAECAAHALAVREPYGVWGGLTEDEREELMGRARHRLVPATNGAPNRTSDGAPNGHSGGASGGTAADRAGAAGAAEPVRTAGAAARTAGTAGHAQG